MVEDLFELMKLQTAVAGQQNDQSKEGTIHLMTRPRSQVLIYLDLLEATMGAS